MALATVVKEWKAVPRVRIDYPASTCQDAASCDLFDVIASDFSAETWGALKPSCDAFAQQLKELPWSRKQPYLCDTYDYNVVIHAGPDGDCFDSPMVALRFACDDGPRYQEDRGYGGPCDYGCSQSYKSGQSFCEKCCYEPIDDDNLTAACDGSMMVCPFYGATITAQDGGPNPLTPGGTYLWSSIGISDPSGRCSQRCPANPWDYDCEALPNAVSTCEVDLEQMIMPNTSYAMTTIISDGMSSICKMLGDAADTSAAP